MYHIKNDKRAQTSAELICAGLLACMREKPFARITITDVQRASTVSRSTFYRNFDGLEDVLALLCDRGFQTVFAEGFRRNRASMCRAPSPKNSSIAAYLSTKVMA